jgi:hypothetical protein
MQSAVSIAALGLLMTGCQGWRFDERPIPSVVQDQQGGKVAVTMKNLDWVVLHNPTLENDSIIGMRTSETIVGSRRTSLPLGSVRSIETRQFSLRRTVGLAVAIAMSPVIAYVSIVDF